MKFQVGDIVRYLNDVGGGTVQKIINATTVEILDESGFSIPVNEKELILIERREKSQQVSDIEQRMPVQSTLPGDNIFDAEDDDIEGNDVPHLLVAFVRNKKDSNCFEMYLVNDCNYHLLYVLSSKEDGANKRIMSGLLEANSKLMVSEFSYEEISRMDVVVCQGSFYKNAVFSLQQCVSSEIQILPIKFYKPGVFVVNDFFDEDAYVIDFYDETRNLKEQEKQKLTQVSQEDIAIALHEKRDVGRKVKAPQSRKKEDVREIDLHIQELVENQSLMEPSEMLDIQMKTFERELLKAVADGLEKIVFIHGVGNGVLKAKIRGCLDRDYPQYFYQDASFQMYKFGATLVYLRKVYK